MAKRYYYVYNTDKAILAVLDIINLAPLSSIPHHKAFNKGYNYSGEAEYSPNRWSTDYIKMSFSDYSKQTGITIKDILT